MLCQKELRERERNRERGERESERKGGGGGAKRTGVHHADWRVCMPNGVHVGGVACQWGRTRARCSRGAGKKNQTGGVHTHTYTRTCTHTHTHTAALPDCMRVFPQRLLAHYFLERLKNGGRNDGFYDPEKDHVGFLLVQVMMIMIMIVQ